MVFLQGRQRLLMLPDTGFRRNQGRGFLYFVVLPILSLGHRPPTLASGDGRLGAVRPHDRCRSLELPLMIQAP